MDNSSSNDRMNATKPFISWFWKSNEDPWSKEEEKWTSYSTQDNILIEQEYSKNQKSVQIGNYILYFEDCLQVHKHDPSKLRPIKRVVNFPEYEERIKEKSYIPPPKRISVNSAGFKKHPSLVYEWCPKADKYDSYSRKCIECAARGILKEGTLQGPKDLEESELIALGLLKSHKIDEKMKKSLLTDKKCAVVREITHIVFQKALAEEVDNCLFSRPHQINQVLTEEGVRSLLEKDTTKKKSVQKALQKQKFLIEEITQMLHCHRNDNVIIKEIAQKLEESAKNSVEKVHKLAQTFFQNHRIDEDAIVEVARRVAKKYRTVKKDDQKPLFQIQQSDAREAYQKVAEKLNKVTSLPDPKLVAEKIAQRIVEKYRKTKFDPKAIAEKIVQVLVENQKIETSREISHNQSDVAEGLAQMLFQKAVAEEIVRIFSQDHDTEQLITEIVYNSYGKYAKKTLQVQNNIVKTITELLQSDEINKAVMEKLAQKLSIGYKSDGQYIKQRLKTAMCTVDNSVISRIAQILSSKQYESCVDLKFHIENPAEQRMLLNYCLQIYSKETFLHKSINKALREEDLSKSNTLGPFCFLLNQFVREFSVYFPENKYFYNKTVYRGAFLSKEVLEEYKAIFNSSYPAFCWNGFTSASKKESIARNFGDVLFIIDMPFSNYGAMDISSFSEHPAEEEVLFPAGSIFKIKTIMNDSIIQLERIDIKQIPFSTPNYKDFHPHSWKRFSAVLEYIKNGELDYSAFTALPLRQNLVEWRALIPGASGTFYDGYIFQIYLNVPHCYPFEAPKVKFETRIWHPNISVESGDICFFDKGWSPALNLEKCFILVQALLSTPDSDQPLEIIAADQLRSNPQEFVNTIRSLCKDAEIIGKKVRNLIEKGVKPCQAKLALMVADFDEEKAFSLCTSTIEELYQAKIKPPDLNDQIIQKNDEN